MNEKKLAWDDVTEYSRATGMKVTHAQMSKTLQNMTNHVKTKTDSKTTGNKKIKLKEWEKQLLLLLGAADNQIFTKVQGSVALGGHEANHECEQCLDLRATCTGPLDVSNGSPSTSHNGNVKTNTHQSYVRPGGEKVVYYENDETKEMSTPQLQRVVLSQQLKLQ
ncbi:hypothetical protein PR048_006706 [Dryococelus australis]|uniref:Regulatory protein zeste n=1 Tax=Dryococelus australis TaxID=614101 RepID=A0ABQ9ICP6_9NEOP|nr:hypothetical protein PR048_006706 [Dryococelus australis]